MTNNATNHVKEALLSIDAAENCPHDLEAAVSVTIAIAHALLALVATLERTNNELRIVQQTIARLA